MADYRAEFALLQECTIRGDMEERRRLRNILVKKIQAFGLDAPAKQRRQIYARLRGGGPDWETYDDDDDV
jgi:hypothetical protein